MIPRPSPLKSAIAALRIRQWTKNGVILVPLLFAYEVFTRELLMRALIATAAFSLLASGVYIANDWIDRERDRLHPEKRHRPIAAGHLSGMSAALLLCAVWAAALGLGSWLGVAFTATMGAYLLLQALYSTVLKHLVILDVMAIALGFIARVVAGASAISVHVSNWLFLCTLLLSIFLGFAKRRAELSVLEGGASAHRSNLADYSLSMIDQMMSISASATILAYGLYTVSKETIDRVGGDHLKYTVPCVIYGVFRYIFLVHKHGAGGAPEKVLLQDVPLLADIAVFVSIAVWALYQPAV